LQEHEIGGAKHEYGPVAVQTRVAEARGQALYLPLVVR
jgi:hypothetical protein